MSTHVKALGMGELVIKPICDSNIYPKKTSEPRVLHGLFSSSQQIIKIQSKCIIFIYSSYKRLNGVQQPTVFTRNPFTKNVQEQCVWNNIWVGDLDFVVGWGLGVKQVSFWRRKSRKNVFM